MTHNANDDNRLSLAGANRLSSSGRAKRNHADDSMERRHDLQGRPVAQSSKLFPLFLLTGLMLPVISGYVLAIDYIGFPNAPHRVATWVSLCILLPLGLLAAAAGQRLVPGRWEGSIIEVLHIRLTYAALAYLSVAVKYIAGGHPLRYHPASLGVLISIILLVSRLLLKFRAKLASVF